MPTLKQRKAVERIIENRGNVSRSMLEVGYSEMSAKNPSNLTESKGYKELCEEYGLTDKLVLEALVVDITQKVGNRKPELELGAKLLGRLKEQEQGKNNTVNFNFFDADTLRKIATRAVDGDSTGEKEPS